MNYKLYSLKSAFDIYKRYIYLTLLYTIAMFTSYYSCYDKGRLNSYDITSIRDKYAVYNADEKELQSVYVCNVQERGKNEEYRHIIYVDANDYEIMVKNKVSVLTRYENAQKGLTHLAIILYIVLTVVYIILFCVIYDENNK